MNQEYILEILTVGNLLRSMTVLFAAALLTRLIHYLRDYAGKHLGRLGHRWEKTAVVAKFLVYTAAVYIIFVHIFSPSANALTAVLGGAAVMIGLAARSFLENIIAGLIILFERPVYVGDRVVVQDYHGDVISINARSTRIKTLDDSIATIPNSVIIREGVKSENAGEVPAMVVINFYFDYNIDLKAARQVLWEATVTSKYFYPKQAVIILVEEQRWQTHVIVKAYAADVRRTQQFQADVTANAKREFMGCVGIYPQFPAAQIKEILD